MKKILCLPLIFSTVLFFSCNSVGDKTNSQEVSPTQNEEQNTQSDTITIQQMQQLPQDTRNEEGNITVRTNIAKPNGLFTEYFSDEEKKKEVFKYNLYYTGDKAYIDDDGYIWFVGRDDDVIKSSDYRIGPFEVESVLLEHEAVIESAVVGSPHATRGFIVKAFIVLNAGCTPCKEIAHDIFTYSKKNLAPYKMPRIIEFVTQLPKTISGKIRRVELRANEAQNKIQRQKIEHEYYL